MIVKHFLSHFKSQNRVQVELPDSIMRLTIDEAIALHAKLGRILNGFLPEAPAVKSDPVATSNVADETK